MTDNRLPLLLEAAMEALTAIVDVGVQRAQDLEFGDAEGLSYLMDRHEDTGQSLDQRLEQAHGKLQEALKLFSKELGIEDDASDEVMTT